MAIWQLQTERRERCKTEMDDAIRLVRTPQMKGLFCEPGAAVNGIGVLYASAEIAAESARRDRLADSLLVAEKAGFKLTRYTALERPVAPVIFVTGGFSC